MAPPIAVEKIPNLLISTTERGSQDHKSLLAFYEAFDVYLTEKIIIRPVVVLSDGHSSRFDFDLLTFLQNKEIRLFLSPPPPPDTTGVTQLLDQVNKNVHLEYKNAKDDLFTQMATINREAFMVILANMWNKWASVASLTKAAKRVGVTPEGLSVQFMQQDKFEQAAGCMEIEEEPSTSMSTPTQSISSPDHRKGSAKYWKEKFLQSQSLIKELNEKSLSLEDIPGLLTIEKVKPKMSKETTRVTQVHGSMHGQDILKLVKEIKEKKDSKKLAVEHKVKQKEDERQKIFRCKENCVCGENKCIALGLKECPSCHSILRSICSKAGCKTNGKRPEMIIPTAATKVSKPLNFDTDDEMEDEADSESDSAMDSDFDDIMSIENEEEIAIEEDPVKAAEKQMQVTWSSLSPPYAEKDIMGKWYGVVWQGKRTETLYVSQVVRRFLVDEDGAVESILMRCLKPKTGSGITLEDTPKHLPPDEFQFKLSNIIAGPFEVIPKGSKYFDVPCYGELQNLFRIVTKMKRDEMCI